MLRPATHVHQRSVFFNYLVVASNGLTRGSMESDLSMQKRFKKKPKKTVADEPDDEDSDAEGSGGSSTLDELPDEITGSQEEQRSSIEKVIDVPNERIDVVAKSGFSTTRKVIEDAFYSHKIRLNGERITKKAQLVNANDEIDLVLGRNPQNIDLLDVKRIKILEIPDLKSTMGRSKIRIMYLPLITIENYREPYESMLVRGEDDPNERKR